MRIRSPRTKPLGGFPPPKARAGWEERGRRGRCTCSTNFGALPGIRGSGATPPRPFPSNLAKLPRQLRQHPLGQRSWRAVTWRKLAPGDGAGGAERARTHTTHLHAARGDTKSCSATPAALPSGGRRPTPRPGAPRRSGGSRAAPGPRGAAQGRPPGPARRARGYPRRRRQRDSRASPSAAQDRRAPSPGDRSRAPSTALPGPGRGPCSPLSPPSFLAEPGAACAHPRAETEHPRGAAAARKEEGGRGGDREACRPAPGDAAAAHGRPLAPGWVGTRG